MQFRLILSTFILSLSLASFAQSERVDHNGGNGGDDDEVMVKNILGQVAHFLNGQEGKKLVADAVDPQAFSAAVKKVKIQVTEIELFDRYNNKRCALNFPEEEKIVFNRSCLDGLRKNVSELYVLVTHELLNIIGLELPTAKTGSIYTISSKIGQVSPSIIAASERIILNPKCLLTSQDRNYVTLPYMAKSILKDKGYEYIGRYSSNREAMVLHIDTAAFQSTTDLKVKGDSVIFRGEEYPILSSFKHSRFNALIILRIKGATPVFVPARTKILSFARGYDIELRKGYQPALVEAMLQLPACVKY
jgi:hypothetical protein